MIADLNLSPRNHEVAELDTIQLDLKTRSHWESRFTHNKITQLPTLSFYFTDNNRSKSNHNRASEVSKFARTDPLVEKFRQYSMSELKTNWLYTNENFWEQMETRTSYDRVLQHNRSQPGVKKVTYRRFKRTQTLSQKDWYEKELSDAIHEAITKVNDKYNAKFVKQVDDAIQMMDPLTAFVNGKANK